MDASTVARWRTLCLILLGAFLGMSVIVYGVRLLPGDVDLHREDRQHEHPPAAGAPLVAPGPAR